jgi:4-hydroxy-tetrahydrodipicolinate synthase
MLVPTSAGPDASATIMWVARQDMKAAATKFRGVFSFIVTPTKDDGEAIDEGRLRESIDYQISQGVHGITVFGSTGGIGSFSEAERRRVIEVAAKHIDGRVRFLPGTGSITTAEAVRLSQFAEGAGADGVLVVPINYWKPTDNELYGHYEAIAQAVKFPVGIYNNPGTTGVDIKPPLVARIAKIDNIGFIKESSGDMSRITAIRQLTGYRISVLNGNDACTPEAIAAGVEGWFAGSGNFMPDKCVELFRLGYENKDIDAMRECFQPMFPLCDFMGVKGYIRVAHTACELLGRPMGPPRRPLRLLESADRAVLAGLLERAGLMGSMTARTAAE